MSGAVLAYLASGVSSTKRHLRSRDFPAESACGRARIDTGTSVDAQAVRSGDRCRQSGCIGGWWAIDQGEAS